MGYLQLGYRVLSVEEDARRVVNVKARMSNPNFFILHESIGWPGTGSRTCGDLIAFFGAPRYLKVDIEFLDQACVASLGGNLSLHPPFISVEFHPPNQELL